MKAKKLILISLILLSIIIYGFSAFHIKSGQVFSVEIDSAKPFSLVWPCEISVVGDDGEKGFRIGPNIGRGWRGEAGGEASYKFYIPQTGQYFLWGYCLWFDECANAVFAHFDGNDKAILGNDPIYMQWHWVKGFSTILAKGTHTIVLSNHSDNISIQKLALINSPIVTPVTSELAFCDIFYDGFDGCDQGNFSSWTKISGKWYVQDPQLQACMTENVLIGESKKRAFIIYPDNHWEQYSLNLSVKTLPSAKKDRAISICFGLRDAEIYHQLKFQLPENTNRAEVKICFVESNKHKEYQLPWKNDIWHQIEVRLNTDNIEVTIDESDSFTIPKDYTIKGGIGLILEGEAVCYFDNIHVRQITGH
jgi:hypothetical protein